MTTKELLKAFVDGATKGSASGGRLRIDGNVLVNYTTPIAMRTKDGVVLNGSYYSRTTSKHQNYLKALLWGAKYYEVHEPTLRKLIAEHGLRKQVPITGNT